MEKVKKPFLALNKDPILTVAFIAAATSAIFIKPSYTYVEYIDGYVLSLLLAMMLVIAGFQKVGLFDFVVDQLLKYVKDTRTLAFVLIGICFFSSMLITNDVALITFVPLSILLLTQTQNQKLLIPIIIMQTIAANLGSMFTPLGNPQNLYLFSISNMTLLAFLKIMLRPTVISFLLILISIFLIKKKRIDPIKERRGKFAYSGESVFWLFMFILCLLAVIKILPYLWVLAIITIGVLRIDRKLLLKVDYGLLVTFVCLFVFIGNLKSIPQVSTVLASVVDGNEITAGILLSQLISNVPAAILLSKFTIQYADLLIGVNLGGLGTLIASMASVISFKFYATTEGAKTGKFLMFFSISNGLFLLVLWGLVVLFPNGA